MTEIVVLHYAEVAAPNWALLRAAAHRRGVRLTSWAPHRLQVFIDAAGSVPYYDGAPRQPAVILHRTVAPFEGIVAPALDLWAGRGVCVLNEPGAAYRARDKLATTRLLTDAGVPVVPTLGFADPGQARWVDFGDSRIVVKPAHGLQGMGIEAYASRADLLDRWHPADDDRRGHTLREHYLAQPLVGGGGTDLRAFVVGGTCVALIRRSARPGELRANLALGATATPLPPTHPGARVATAATAACGLDYGGVDLIEDADGTLRVLEVDAWAGFAGVTAATGADVAGAILDLALARRRKEPAPT
ncbi:MAG TPA: hypothetical protein VES42_12190 [Pilimelia sp.]|nr:hypothetical protein [Pilimelia sp.]